jgi:serine/threonine protein phosphatase PrpC
MRTDARRRPLRAAGVTDVGRQRTVNEDRFHVDASRGIFMVVDGIGGHAAGDKASDVAIATIRERLDRQTGPVPDRIREAITIANNEIYRTAATRPDWYGMACVLTVAVVDGDRAVVGHVGDSRLYRLRGDEIEKVTPDHSPVGEREDANELSELEAMQHPRRNEVYRDVGSEPRSVSDGEFVFLTEIELPPDAALLICSDGLTDQVPAETIRQVVRSAGGSPERVARALIEAANDAGGKDNVTVVLVEGERFRSAVALADPGPAGTYGNRVRSRLFLSFALLATIVAGFALGLLWDRLDWTGGAATRVLDASPSPRIVVQPNESIAAALAQAAPGAIIVVEPGEYRERFALRDGVRLLSRVPRGATLRLPEGAAERDAAVMAIEVENAELAGFRIVGDAATPLGIGVVVQDASVQLVDIEVSGAAIAALELGRGDEIVLGGSDIHDNPGSAVLVRSGATPRLTHNVFARNAASAGSRPAFVIEGNARPVWFSNVFQDVGPESVGGIDGPARAALEQGNWFVGVRPKQRPSTAERGARR